MTPQRTVVALAVALAARTVAADPACSPGEAAAEAAALRAQLDSESARADRWNLAWGIGFGAASAGQLGLAVGKWNPFGAYDRTYRDTLYVGAGKAAIGSLGRFVTPLRVHVPAAVADPCADLVALRGALADAGRLERRLFWTSHIGGFLVSLGGAVILATQISWPVGAISFAVSYPVGLLSAYTMPRGSWHAWRSLRVTTIVPVPVAGGGVALTVGGTW